MIFCHMTTSFLKVSVLSCYMFISLLSLYNYTSHCTGYECETPLNYWLYLQGFYFQTRSYFDIIQIKILFKGYKQLILKRKEKNQWQEIIWVFTTPPEMVFPHTWLNCLVPCWTEFWGIENYSIAVCCNFLICKEKIIIPSLRHFCED
jgi:hypothetical protein